MKLRFVFVVSFMPRKLLITKPCKSTLLDVSAERLKASRTRTEYVKQGFVVKKEIGINQTNENTLSHLTMNAQTVFLGKSLYPYCINCIFLIFLKRLLNQQFAPLKGLGGNCIFDVYQLYLFAPFCIFLLKIIIFNVTSCKVYL